MNSALLWFSLSISGPPLVALMLNEVTKLRALVADVSDDPLEISMRPMRLVMCGVAFLSLALATTFSIDVFHDVFPINRWARVMAFIIASSFFVSYGALAYIYGAILMLVVRLGKTRVRGDIFSWPHESIEAIHAIYVRLLLAGGAAYLLGVGVVRFTPWARNWHDLNQPWILLWVFPPGLAAIIFFGFFSFALHKLLLQCRTRSEREINEQLQRIYNTWKTNSEPGTESSISALLKWRENIRLNRVWPMDFKAVIATIVTLLIPTIEAIAKLAGWITG